MVVVCPESQLLSTMALCVRFTTWFMLCNMVLAQQAGTEKQEAHLPFNIESCSEEGCKTESITATFDMQWRWMHGLGGYKNCYVGGWDKQICPDPNTCAQKCAVEGMSNEDYSKTGGQTSIPDGVQMQFVAPSGSSGSRIYLIGPNEKYKLFRLKNREFAFDVDVSQLPCGLIGAAYFVEMDEAGSGKAGAKLGTGYCDAQCGKQLKFIDGKANFGWKRGACCMELDLWEANSRASVYTAHPCKTKGYVACEGAKCGTEGNGGDHSGEEDTEGLCNKGGCGFNSFRMGDEKFYGPGSDFSVDTTKPITVVTQFLTEGSKDEGDLVEIRRYYVQAGKVIVNSNATILPKLLDNDEKLDNAKGGDSLTDTYCSAQNKAFNVSTSDFQAKGGLKRIGEALERGMVLALSINSGNAWLDGVDAGKNGSASDPGAKRGPCPDDSYSIPELKKKHGKASVKFSNIKYGQIGWTLKAKKIASKVSKTGTPKVPKPEGGKSQCGWKSCAASALFSVDKWCGKSKANCLKCKGGQWCATGAVTRLDEEAPVVMDQWPLRSTDSNRRFHAMIAVLALVTSVATMAFAMVVSVWRRRSVPQQLQPEADPILELGTVN